MKLRRKNRNSILFEYFLEFIQLALHDCNAIVLMEWYIKLYIFTQLV